MKCPFCGTLEDRVVDSRPTDEGDTIRRRRECAKCLKRFTTYEKIEILPLVVIKKDNSRENFDRDKLMRGISRACEKRPVSADDVHKLVDEIETHLSNSLEREVKSQSIGELLMDKLKKLDQVAYVRFASVYRDFGDIDTFIDEIHKIRTEEKLSKRQTGPNESSDADVYAGVAVGVAGDGDVDNMKGGSRADTADYAGNNARVRQRQAKAITSVSRPPRRKRPRRIK